MPVLPIIDLLIFVGWTSILIGGVLKAIYVSTTYRPTFFGLEPLDLLLVASCALLFSVALAARTWVRANEPGILAARRRMGRVQDLPAGGAPEFGAEPEPVEEAAAVRRSREAMPSVGGR